MTVDDAAVALLPNRTELPQDTSNMISQLARLLADYIGTFASLARAEASQDVTNLVSVAKRWGMAAAAALLGVVWLNVALLLWLLQSPWRVGGAFAVAVILLAAAFFLVRSKPMGARGVLPQTRELVRTELQEIRSEAQSAAQAARAEPGLVVDVPAARANPPRPEPAAPPMTPVAARARLRALRNRMGQVMAPPESTDLPAQQAEVSAVASTGVARAGFVPRSRTMRLLMNYWGGPPKKGTVGTIVSSLLGFVALRSSKLQRAAMTVGTARNFTRILGRRLRRA